jgi:hypothetical protein
MKKVLMVTVLVLGLGVSGYALAGYWGPGGDWGHMMGSGYGYGGPMMGPGYQGNRGQYSGMPCWDDSYGANGGQKLSEKDAASIVSNYIGGNPNLKAGKIEDKTTYFETEIRTKENSLVSKLAIDKNTGWVRPINE